MTGPQGSGSEPPFCARCGRPEAEGDHEACRRAMALEPPRYCAQCRRRLVVQVLPTGWTASCSAHGELPAVRTSVLPSVRP